MFDFIAIAVFLVLIFIFKPDKKIESGEVNVTDYCEGNKCKNTCQKTNATMMKPGGIFNAGFDSDGNEVPDIKFQASDCNEGTKLIQNYDLCGTTANLPEDQRGEVECTSIDCCENKTCGSDRFYSTDDMLDYLQAKNNITEEDRVLITSSDTFSIDTFYSNEDTTITDERRRILDDKINRDGYCPYQMTAVNQNTECIGETTGIGGDCTIDECCIPKTCANNWVSDQNPEWGSETTCPHQPDNVDDRGNSMIKYPDDTPCDTCDISECCYEQSNFCIVEANGDYNHANTNVQNVAFPSGTSLSFPANDNTSVDLTTNYFLRKEDIENNTDNIKDILSFGVVGGNINSDNNFGIKCEDGFKYGMCSSTDGSIDDDACKTHDNNQRECEAAGCSFTLGDRPRVEYDECGGAADHNIIKVHDCINTCTADYTLSDNGINYFTQTPISEGANIGSYRVNPLYDNTGKNSGQEFESGTNITKYCNNYFGTGEPLYYNYNCEGGGSYFTVGELENCNSTCGDLHSQGANCAENKIYPETDPDTNSLLSNFADFNENCCIPKTCNNGSSGTEIGCRNYEKIIETESPVDSSGAELPINSNNCCERLTCNDYLNEFNRVSVEGGHEVITSENICSPDSGTFRPENLVSFNYLNSFTPGGSDSEKYDIFKSYQDGISQIDIGCCQQLTCQEWADNPGNIPAGSDQASANRYCNNNEDGINVFDMSGNFNGNSLDEAVEPGNNSCCISSENITCRPSDELMNPTGLVGYENLPEVMESIEFEYDPSISNFSTVVGDNPFRGVTCQDGATGEPTLQCTRDANGDNHLYTITGCNVESNENICQEGQSLANGDPKFCVLPNLQDDEHHGIVLSDFITGVSGNAIVNVRNFAHQLDNIQCVNSTSHPCMRECTNDVLTTSYGGVQTEISQSDYDSSVHIHIQGCDYQNDFKDSGDFFTDRFYNGDNGYQECNTLYQSRQMPSDFNPTDNKINVKHFKCHCGGTQEDPNLPNYGGQLAESCDPSDRHIRFKYVFDDDVDYLTDDKRHIKNSDALAIDGTSYNQGDILNSGDSICEPGYYPYRGDKEDYCKPCTDLYKNNHPVSAIADRFCNSGHLFDSGDNISLLRRPEIRNTEYNSNYESNSSDISVLRPTRVLGDGNTRTNQEYGPYLGNLGEDVNSIDFMTADNFTLGTRVCDPEPDGSTACAPKVKLYGDYNQDATEGSQFEKAKKWWKTYFNNVFNIGESHTDNSDILDISSAPSESSVPDESKPTLKSIINGEGRAVDLYGRQQDINNYLFSGFRGGRYAYSYTINDITDLKKEHYLYRNNLELSMPINGGSNEIPISTVCNNNTSDVDYIPSFDSVGSNEGSCKECVNEMPANDERIQNGNAPPRWSPGDYIIRNINNNDNAPICSYEANMYNESYNEGNIIGFKSKSDNSEYIGGQGPCNEGFIYSPNGKTELLEYQRGGLNGDLSEFNRTEISYIKCFPQTRLITKYCENIDDEENIDKEEICNKSFSTYLSNDVKGRLSDELKEKLETDERQMINDAHIHGFCGWDNSENKCKNIYDTDSGYLRHKSLLNSHREYSAYSGEDYSYHKSLYKQQSVLNILSPHITSYSTSRDYDYSNLYNNLLINNENAVPEREIPPGIAYTNHETHDGDIIKGAADDVFDISNYGVGKGDASATGGDDLTSLSIANTLKEGYDFSFVPEANSRGQVVPPFIPHISNHPSANTSLHTQPIQPTRINPYQTVLNDTMKNRCHPILWDGPVDFFYENYSFPLGANGEPLPKTTISSSCYLRKYSDISDSNSMRTQDNTLVPNNSGDFSIKSTPLYYNKGRTVDGGTITTTDYDNEDRTHNILNPDSNRDGLMYAYRYKAGDNDRVPSTSGNKDSGFADAAVFPLIDRVRGCFNDSLIYPGDPPSDSSLGLDADNINNEREQCIFHYNAEAWHERAVQGHASTGGAARLCVNACLNNNECDLVRMTYGKPDDNSLRCELLKWNKLPDTINTKNTALIDQGQSIIDDGQQSLLGDDNTLKAPNLGGHLINANADYDQSTRQGVVNWFQRISDPDATEMNHIDTVSGNGEYRTEFYSQSDTDSWSDIRDWRMNHLFKSGTSGQEIEIKGRPLWKPSTDDKEVWVSMNKIRAPTPDGKITDILNNINNYELLNKDIQPIDSGEVEWRSTGGTDVRLGNLNNGENTYISNDSPTTYLRKFNEKTVIDSSGNHKECPPGTYVQETDGSYKCSQVINECANCKDIYDYHEKKGDFKGLNGAEINDAEKNKILRSYGCNVADRGFVWNYIGYSFFSRNPNWCYNNDGKTDCGRETNSNENIFDSIGSVYRYDGSSYKFSNQHNLMAKTPDGNIIDVEKCRCPINKTVYSRRVQSSDLHQPIGMCK